MNRRNRVLLYGMALLAMLAGGWGAYWYLRAPSFHGRVCLVPFGKIPAQEVEAARAAIEQFYGFEVTVLPRQALPQMAYVKARNRYHANGLLDYLKSMRPPEQDKIIGLTQFDIATDTPEHRNWGVIGLAELGGSPGVVSTFRLLRDRPTATTRQARWAKVTLHELGHTLGIPHCDQNTEYCFMNDASGSVRTIDKERIKLCDRCSALIEYTRSSR